MPIEDYDWQAFTRRFESFGVTSPQVGRRTTRGGLGINQNHKLNRTGSVYVIMFRAGIISLKMFQQPVSDLPLKILVVSFKAHSAFK